MFDTFHMHKFVVGNIIMLAFIARTSCLASFCFDNIIEQNQ